MVQSCLGFRQDIRGIAGEELSPARRIRVPESWPWPSFRRCLKFLFDLHDETGTCGTERLHRYVSSMAADIHLIVHLYEAVGGTAWHQPALRPPDDVVFFAMGRDGPKDVVRSRDLVAVRMLSACAEASSSVHS